MQVPVHVSGKGGRRRRRKHRPLSQDWSSRSRTSQRLWSSTNASGIIWQQLCCKYPAVIVIFHALFHREDSVDHQLAWLVLAGLLAQVIAVCQTPLPEVRSRGAMSEEERRLCLYQRRRRPLMHHKVHSSSLVTDLRLLARRLRLSLLRPYNQHMLRYNRP